MSHRLLRRSVWDFIKATYLLRSPGRLVTVFASARLGCGDEEYEMARRLGRALAVANVAVMTGGGSGLMEAINRGAREGGGRSLGCRMAGPPFELEENRFMDRCSTVRHFFVRKVVMCRSATAFIVLPGGLGTLDELFDVLALIKTGRMPAKPVVLLGTTFWQPLLRMLEAMMAAGTIPAGHMPGIEVTDDVGEAVELVTRPFEPTRAEPLAPFVAIDRAS